MASADALEWVAGVLGIGFDAGTYRLLEGQLDASPTVAVIGLVSRGKSTLVNQLVGTQVMPVGARGETAANVEFASGSPRAQIWLEDGSCETIAPEVSTFTERLRRVAAPSVRRGRLEANFRLPAGLTLIDTPGFDDPAMESDDLGYLDEHWTRTGARGAVLVVSVPPGFGRTDRRLLEAAHRAFTSDLAVVVKALDADIPSDDLEQVAQEVHNQIGITPIVLPEIDDAGPWGQGQLSVLEKRIERLAQTSAESLEYARSAVRDQLDLIVMALNSADLDRLEVLEASMPSHPECPEVLRSAIMSNLQARRDEVTRAQQRRDEQERKARQALLNEQAQRIAATLPFDPGHLPSPIRSPGLLELTRLYEAGSDFAQGVLARFMGYPYAVRLQVGLTQQSLELSPELFVQIADTNHLDVTEFQKLMLSADSLEDQVVKTVVRTFCSRQPLDVLRDLALVRFHDRERRLLKAEWEARARFALQAATVGVGLNAGPGRGLPRLQQIALHIEHERRPGGLLDDPVDQRSPGGAAARPTGVDTVDGHVLEAQLTAARREVTEFLVALRQQIWSQLRTPPKPDVGDVLAAVREIIPWWSGQISPRQEASPTQMPLTLADGRTVVVRTEHSPELVYAFEEGGEIDGWIAAVDRAEQAAKGRLRRFKIARTTVFLLAFASLVTIDTLPLRMSGLSIAIGVAGAVAIVLIALVLFGFRSPDWQSFSTNPLRAWGASSANDADGSIEAERSRRTRQTVTAVTLAVLVLSGVSFAQLLQRFGSPSTWRIFESQSLPERPSAPPPSDQPRAAEETVDTEAVLVDPAVPVAGVTERYVLGVAGSGRSSGLDVAASSDGTAFVIGSFTDTALFGDIAVTTTNEGVFVAKVDADGAWLWAASAGGPGDAWGAGIAATSDGSAIITGAFAGSVTFGATTLTAFGTEWNPFVAKIDADGRWLWAVSAAASGDAFGRDVSVFDDGSVVVIGNYSDTIQFDQATLVADRPNGSIDHLFVARVSAGGGWLWATGTDGTAGGFAVATLTDGSVMVTGSFTDRVRFGTAEVSSAHLSPGGENGFVARIDASGQWMWVQSFVGPSDIRLTGVASTADGSAVIAGFFREFAYFAETTLTAGGVDSLIARIAPDGRVHWVAQADGSNDNGVTGVAASGDGATVVIGEFRTSVRIGGEDLRAPDDETTGGQGTFVARLDADGRWGFAEAFSGPAAAFGVSAAEDRFAFVAGHAIGPVTIGGLALDSDGSQRAFVAAVE